MLKNFFKEEFTLWKAQLTNTTGSPKKEYDQPIIILGKQSEKKVIMQKNAIDTLVSNRNKNCGRSEARRSYYSWRFYNRIEPVDTNFEIRLFSKKISINGLKRFTLYL